MRSFRIFVLAFFMSALSLQGQIPEPILQSYERIFIRSSLDTKVNVLQDAATDDRAAEFYGPLCSLALDFVLENAGLFRDDPDMIQIALIAIRGVGSSRYNPGAENLWQVFLQFPDRVIRLEVLQTLPSLDWPPVIEKINRFLGDQNNLYASAISPDPPLLSALFTALGSIGDSRSYPVLFASALLYPGDLGVEAARALYAVGGDLPAFLRSVVLKNPPAEKLAAFKMALAWENPEGGERGELAETALEAALGSPASGGAEELTELRRSALALIRETRWTRAFPQVFTYYTRAMEEFRKDPSRKEDLFDAIACLSALENADAARVLGLQLGLYNSRAASLSGDENEVVLALVRALGDLAYKASFDSLTRIGSLPYPEEIIGAAQEALDKLQW
ncbi:MAG: hypothetical protein LBO65_04040 [Spirochaetaceae bacterium]|jgi:hypothetical protein|nr:hypothetical protein [Spirochaetaceae bacterium]